MSRKRNRHVNKTRIRTDSPQQFPTLPYAPPGSREENPQSLIGMFSIKTIKNRSGRIIVHKGQEISEDILSTDDLDDVIRELQANAMPGRSSR